MPKFRKKPVVIEAMQYNGLNASDIFLWSDEHDDGPAMLYTPNGIEIETLEGVMTAAKDDWIIRGVKGEFYPCKPDIFAATYEPVDDAKGAGDAPA